MERLVTFAQSIIHNWNGDDLHGIAGLEEDLATSVRRDEILVARKVQNAALADVIERIRISAVGRPIVSRITDTHRVDSAAKPPHNDRRVAGIFIGAESRRFEADRALIVLDCEECGIDGSNRAILTWLGQDQ